MKTHFKVWSYCDNNSYRQVQEMEGLYLDYYKLCDGKMVLKEDRKYMTLDNSLVTCKKCLKKLKITKGEK